MAAAEPAESPGAGRNWALLGLSTAGLVASLGYWAVSGFIALVELLGDCPPENRHCRSSAVSLAWLSGSTIGALSIYLVLVAAARWAMRRWRPVATYAGLRGDQSLDRTFELGLIPPAIIVFAADIISSLGWGIEIVSHWPVPRLVGLGLSAAIVVLLMARWYRVAPPRLGCGLALVLAVAVAGLAIH